MSKPMKILFIPLDSTGHVNACIGIAEQLLNRGHQVTFALEESWKGKLSLQFSEVLYMDPSRQPGLAPNEYWIQSMRLIEDTLHQNALYKAGHQNVREFEEFILNELNFDDQLEALIKEVDPDVIVVDNYFSNPAVYKSGYRWIQMTSANPLSVILHANTPPGGSGYPTNGDRAEWKLFEDTFGAHYGPTVERFERRIMELGLPPLPEGQVFHPSPYLNIYAYPEELDYLDIRPLPEKWMRFDHFIRSATITDRVSQWEIPEKLNQIQGKLVYVSMGSMACSDEKLMRRLIEILSTSPNRFIMVMGPNYDKIDLPSNIWGQPVLPQIDILPKIDLVITHGGNNSVLESLLFGKPMIINPLFADQYDNAQRVTEKGFGFRVNAYTCEPEELKRLIEAALGDEKMVKRLEVVSKRLKQSRATEKAAEAIEEVGKMELVKL